MTNMSAADQFVKVMGFINEARLQAQVLEDHEFDYLKDEPDAIDNELKSILIYFSARAHRLVVAQRQAIRRREESEVSDD